MYSGIFIGSHKIKSAFLGSEELYKSEYTIANVKKISGVATSAAYVDMGDYMAAITRVGVYKVEKTSDALELIASPSVTSINSSYSPCQAWRRGANEIVVMFNKNISESYGFIFAILDTTSWTYTTISDTLQDSEGGAYPTGCYDALNDIVYFWKTSKLRTWKPSTNVFTAHSATTDHQNKMFIDVDGSLKSFKWSRTSTAQVYNIVNGIETEAYTFDTAEWADEYAGNNIGFIPTSRGLAYQLTVESVIEFNLNDRTVKAYPLATTGLYYQNAWAICEAKGFLAVNAQNSSDIYILALQ